MLGIVVKLMIGYLIIGGMILAVQLFLPKLFEPECPFGRIRHTLTDKYLPRRDPVEELEKTRAGRRDPPWYFGVGLGVARWLPDFYQQVFAGDTSFRDYLLGGYQCSRIMDIPKGRPPVAFRPEKGGPILGPGPSAVEVLKEKGVKTAPAR
jgi:hypothetical protein